MRAVAVMVAVVLLAACGGDGGGSAEDDDGAEQAAVDGSTAVGADDEEGVDPSPPADEGTATAEVDGVEVRFVNLFREEGQGRDIDVWWGSETFNPGAAALTVPYGTATDYMAPVTVGDELSDSPDVRIFYTRAGDDPSAWLVTEDEPLQPGDQVTFFVGNMLEPGDPARPGISNVFYEASSWTTGLPDPDAASVLLFANQTATSFGDGSDGEGALSTLGAADGSGCLEFSDEGPSGLLATPVATVAPGTAIADFGTDTTCTSPISDAVTVGDAGTRAVVYTYNDGAERRLLLLDIAG